MDIASKELYGQEFCHAICKIQQKYLHSNKHGALSVQGMLKTLAG